ncbi:MAG: RNA methyltransferase [Patescibacteria group bacterium]
MLTKSQQRLLLALQKRKEREARGMFIIEGEKFVRDAGSLVEFTFTPRDTTIYREVISTEAPQGIAAVARVPVWTMADILSKPTIVVLDGIQDPGNVGTVLRACLGFDASLLLVESAEVTNPKTVRSSASAILRVPWKAVSRDEAPELLASFARPIFRLELKKSAVTPAEMSSKPRIVIAGNEGKGIKLPVNGTSVAIPHDPKLESLNVAMATSIVLYELCRNLKS